MYRFLSCYWSVRCSLVLAVEATLLFAAAWSASAIRSWVEGEAAWPVTHLPLRAAVFAAVMMLALYANGLYDFNQRLSAKDMALRLLRSLALGGVALLALYYISDPALTLGRGAFAIACAFAAVSLSLWRLPLSWTFGRQVFVERILIVGTDRAARELAVELLTLRHLGYRVLGFLTADPSEVGMSLLGFKVVGTTSQVLQLARDNQVARVVVAQEDKRGTLDMDSLLACKTSGIQVVEASTYLERLTSKIAINGLRKSWLIFSQGFVVSAGALALKRLLDITVALVGLLVTAPIMALTALFIRLDSTGEVLFRQERVGRHGKVFTLWKFRSMGTDAEATGTALWAQRRDPRITRVGRLIRKLRVDELPQLWNVLVGDMSMVGPRPERRPFVDQLSKVCPLYTQRLVVRPGLTGWAQIHANYAASIEESMEKLKYDLFYIKNLSVFLDLVILAATARTILSARGAH